MARGKPGHISVVYTADTKQFNKKLNEVNSKIKAFGSKVGTAFRLAAAAATATAVAGVAKGVSAFSDFEAQINEVRTLLPDIDDGAMKQLSDDIRGVAREFGIVHEQAVPALYQALSAGVPANNVIEFMDVAAKAAIGGVTDLETAVDGISTVVNGYGAEVISATEASDLMFTTVRLGKTTYEELSASMSNVTPLAAAVGVTFEEVSASLAVLTAQGVPTAQATTQIRGALAELSKDGSKADKVFREISGKSFPEFIEQGGTFGEALGMMSDHAEANDLQLQNMFSRIEAGVAVLALTKGDMEAFDAALEEMGDSAGATGKAFETIDEGFGRTWAKIKVAFHDVFISIGDAVAPFLASIMEKLQPALTAVSNWFADGKFAKAVNTIKDRVAVFAGHMSDIAGWVWDRIKPGIDAIKVWFTDLADLAGVVSGELGKWASRVTDAMPDAVASVKESFDGIRDAMVGLVSDGGFLRDRFDQVRGIIGNLGGAFDWIGESISMIVEHAKSWVAEGGALAGLWEAMRTSMPAIKNVAKAIGVALGVVAGVVGTLIIALSPILKGVLKTALELISGAFDVLAGVIEVVTGILTGDFSRVWDGLKSMFEGLLGIMLAPFEGLWTGIKAILDGLLGNLLAKVGDLASSAGNKFLAAFKLVFVTLPSKAVMWMITWPSKMAATVTTWGMTIANTLIDKIKSVITGAWGRLRTGFVDMLQALWDNGATIWSKATEIGGKIVSGIVGKIKSGIVGAINWIIGKFNSLIDGFNKVPFVNIPKISRIAVGAEGAVVTKPTMALIGEAGPEAVVPLNSMPGASPLPDGGMGGVTVNVVFKGSVLGLDSSKLSRELAKVLPEALQRADRDRGRISNITAV